MTQTMTKAGTPLFFPGGFALDDDGVIIAPPVESLPAIAAAVASDGLALFTRRLVDAARKRRFQARYRAVNKRRLQLAVLCVERWLEEEADAAFEQLDREGEAPARMQRAS